MVLELHSPSGQKSTESLDSAMSRDGCSAFCRLHRLRFRPPGRVLLCWCRLLDRCFPLRCLGLNHARSLQIPPHRWLAPDCRLRPSDSYSAAARAALTSNPQTPQKFDASGTSLAQFGHFHSPQFLLTTDKRKAVGAVKLDRILRSIYPICIESNLISTVAASCDALKAQCLTCPMRPTMA